MTAALTDDQLRLVRSILDAVVPGAERLAFGSRLGRSQHPCSDLGIGISAVGPLPPSRLSALEAVFAASDLPFRVGVVDLHRVPPAFRRSVFATHVRI